MIKWISRKSDDARRQFVAALLPTGVEVTQAAPNTGRTGRKFPGELLEAEIGPFLHQLEDDGFASATTEGWLISWSSLYDLMEHAEYRFSYQVLGLPLQKSFTPVLQSRNSLTDQEFSISISHWNDQDGQRIGSTQLTGGMIQCGSATALLKRSAWELVSAVVRFSTREQDQRNSEVHRLAWGEMRKLATAAGAHLDEFLFRTIILTPDHLEIGLKRTTVGGTRVVEVQPKIPDAPQQWLDRFDALSIVPDRYDIPTADGIVQILIRPEVKTVLEQIKRLPGRRVAGARAEAFLANPFATLGGDANLVLDPEQFERAREQAGIYFERFTAAIQRDRAGYPINVGLLVETISSQGPIKGEAISFANDAELGTFIKTVRKRINEGMQLCAWHGFDLELSGDTSAQVDLLEEALSERRKPHVIVSYANIYDLSNYSDRIDQIGVEKPYHSAYIAKKDNSGGWFPDNVLPVVAWTPEGTEDPVAVPFTKDLEATIRSKLKEAESLGQETIELNGFDRPMPVKDARSMLETFGNALDSISKNEFDPDKPRRTDGERKGRKSLVVRANIQAIDYEETRREILTVPSGKPRIPSSLKGEVELKDHQSSGIAWLQNLFDKSPDYCRGVILADDMGLGKTLQLLTLIVSALEQDTDLAPALVVAPVALLENWKEELEKFFSVDRDILLTAYGDALASLRVPRSSIDEQLTKEGMVRFLKPGWRGRSKIVLTTYETLRDLEFSFAAEQWSIMICDEAQKIKNPNALVSRAAKKQSVRFKIACTGTPVENTLADLWCLFDFVQPGLLGALNEFGERYRKPIEAETSEEKARVDELRSKIAPQILRRMKKDVAKDLKQKIVVEDCSRLPFSSYQRLLYAQAIDHFQKRGDQGSANPFKNHLALLHYLRLVCADPRPNGLNEFRPEPLQQYRARSPKLDWLLKKLAEIRSRGEKAIIFCEFRAIQRLLRHYCEEALDVTAEIVNGDTSVSAGHTASRQKRIKAFQEKPGFGVIILSPLAVGFGVNIQAANHVVHFTQTWNPAKEDQATDRAYRIGQKKDVYVYYPIVHADDFTTFDVKLDKLLSSKRALADDMLNEPVPVV